jgi:hypothetical protein
VTDLLAWLRAQVDTDERLALAVEDRSAPWNGEWTAPEEGYGVRTHNGWTVVSGHGQTSLPPGVAVHIANHDPARALREVAAKRAILASHDPIGTPCDTCSNDWVVVRWPCPTVRAIAAIYTDRPGWREEWTA